MIEMIPVPIAREQGGKFAKGVSPNPGGKPSALREITHLARTMCPDALATLHRIATDPAAPVFAQIAAAESLLNRGFGKPQQSVAVQVDDVQRGREVDAVLQALRQGGPLSRDRFLPLINAQVVEDTGNDE